MRKTFWIMIILTIFLTACDQTQDEGSPSALAGEINTEEHSKDNEIIERLTKEKESVEESLTVSENRYLELSEKYDELSKSYQETKGSYHVLKKEYENYKKTMEEYKTAMAEYEGLAEAEAKSRLITAEKIIAEEEARIQKELEEEERKREEEEKKGYNTGLTYKQLARTPDEYEGEKVKCTGKVAQVIDGDKLVSVRLAVKGSYDSVVYCVYDPKILDFRILEDDQITIYGVSEGLYSYKSTGAGVITIPCVSVDKIELKSKK